MQQLQKSGRELTKFIVTHIDADHISGAIAFIKENGPTNSPTIIPIKEIWFNSYRHLSFDDKVLGKFENEPPDFHVPPGNESAETEDEEQLVSYNQGTTLGYQILKNGYPWNTSFGGKAVKSDAPITFSLSPDLQLTLLGPTTADLDGMGSKWRAYLSKLFSGPINEDAFFDDAFEKMMEEMRQAALELLVHEEESFVSSSQNWVEQNALEWEKEDTSPTNASSITFLLEYHGKKMLFLADAHPTKIIRQLQKLIPEDQFPLHVDALKVTHHGAWGNNSPQLLEMIRADYYLFSSNGKRHHHPHVETLAWILKQHQNHKKNFVFNYQQEERLQALESLPLKQEYNYQTVWPEVDQWGNGKDGYVKIELP